MNSIFQTIFFYCSTLVAVVGGCIRSRSGTTFSLGALLDPILSLGGDAGGLLVGDVAGAFEVTLPFLLLFLLLLLLFGDDGLAEASFSLDTT